METFHEAIASQERSDSNPLMVTNYYDKKYEYAFTIRDNRTGSEDYDSFVAHLKKFGDVTHLRYETKSKTGQPVKRHLHGILKTNDKLYFKSTRMKGYHTHYKLIYNSNWEAYCNKQDTALLFSDYAFSKKTS